MLFRSMYTFIILTTCLSAPRYSYPKRTKWSGGWHTEKHTHRLTNRHTDQVEDVHVTFLTILIKIIWSIPLGPTVIRSGSGYGIRNLLNDSSPLRNRIKYDSKVRNDVKRALCVMTSKKRHSERGSAVFDFLVSPWFRHAYSQIAYRKLYARFFQLSNLVG